MESELLKFINKFVAFKGNNIELEVRFGKFKANKFTENAKFFESNVEIDFFYRVKNFLDANPNHFTKTIINTVEASLQNYSEKRSSFKRVINIDTKETTYMKKTSLQTDDLENLDLRFAVSSETLLSQGQISNLDWSQSKFTRTKNRLSYMYNSVGKIDLTIVKESGRANFNKYEIEFELNSNTNVNEIMNVITTLLNISQNNFYVTSEAEKKNVLTIYSNLLKTSRFVGAQPETLQKDHLSLLYKELYSVTDKADGDRFLMIIDPYSNVFFVDNNLNVVLKTDVTCPGFANCVIDGELIRDVDESKHLIKISFYAFDICVFNGVDIRGNNNFLLRERLNALRSIVEATSISERYTIALKKFIYRNVFMGSEIIMSDIANKPYQNDGLIFTPMNEPYPVQKKWPKLLKWKPAELNTIDFYSKQTGPDTWELFVQEPGQKDPRTNRQEKSTKVLFDVAKLCPGLSEQQELTFKTTFNIIDPTTNEPFQSNTVIEYSWNGHQFVPLRTRWDKTSNPTKHGNFVHVACDIWKNIQNPIEPMTLFKMRNDTTVQTQSGQGFFF